MNLLYILYLLVIALTATDSMTIADNVTYGRIAFILMILVSLFYPHVFIPQKKFFLHILFVFVFYIGISIPFSDFPDITATRFLYLLQYYIIIVVGYNVIRTKKQIFMMLYAYIAGALVIAIKSIIEYITGTAQIANDIVYRAEGVGNPNENSFMIVLAMIFCVILLFNKSLKHKQLHNATLYIALCIFTIAIFSNGSRMGFVIMIVVGITSFFTFIRKANIKQKTLLVIGVFILISIIIKYISDATFDRLLNINQDIASRNFANREWIWEIAVRMISSYDFNWLIGSGWGTFPYKFQIETGLFMGAHNFYITLFYTTGIIGSVIIAIYLFDLLIQIKNSGYTHKLIYYLLLLIPLISMMSTNWEGRRWLFLIGLFVYKIKELNNGTSTGVRIK